MPIEIKELIIKATVQDPSGDGEKKPLPKDEAARADLVAECVEKVLERLQLKKER